MFGSVGQNMCFHGCSIYIHFSILCFKNFSDLFGYLYMRTAGKVYIPLLHKSKKGSHESVETRGSREI